MSPLRQQIIELLVLHGIRPVINEIADVINVAAEDESNYLYLYKEDKEPVEPEVLNLIAENLQSPIF